MQEALKSENYHLKNEITDLKNAFDLNRDILKIISTYEARVDPNQHLLMQIITRLTTVNNQAMINYLDAIHQKNECKQENLKLKIQIKKLQEKVSRQIENNRLCNNPTQSKAMIQDQLSHLNNQLMAISEQKMIQQKSAQYWRKQYLELEKDKNKFSNLEIKTTNGSKTNRLHNNLANYNNQNIVRKYTSNEHVNLESELIQKRRQNKKLTHYIEELESRLILLVKAHNLIEQVSRNKEKKKNRYYETFEKQKEQIRLLKYALNDIHLEKKEDDLILTVTERFKKSNRSNNVGAPRYRQKNSFSWPKNKIAGNNEAAYSENSQYQQEQAEISMTRGQY